jgi:hypothetical protein
MSDTTEITVLPEGEDPQSDEALLELAIAELARGLSRLREEGR